MGCGECLETGFSGRTSLTELLVVDEVFRESVLQKLPNRALQKIASDRGMITLWMAGLRRVARGQVPLEEIMRVVSAEGV